MVEQNAQVGGPYRVGAGSSELYILETLRWNRKRYLGGPTSWD